MLSQIVGTLGLTVTAPAASYVATGTLDRAAWALWMANLLFVGDQIHFVQLRLRSTRASGWTQKFASGRNFFAGQMLLATALIFAWRFALVPALAALAFLPLLIRGTLVLRAPAPPAGFAGTGGPNSRIPSSSESGSSLDSSSHDKRSRAGAGHRAGQFTR